MHRRDSHIDTLRGIACLLLVAYHGIGDGSRGLRLPDDHMLRIISDSLVYLRMPLFTFLSGYVYALRPPAGFQDAGRFLRGKARRLLFPLLSVGLLYQCAQLAMPGVNRSDAGFDWLYWLLPYEHFWFLQSIVLIITLVFLVDALGWLNRTWKLTFATAVVFLVFSHFRFETNIFSINGALYMLPYFLMGMLLRRHENQAGKLLLRGWPLLALALMVLTCIVLEQRPPEGIDFTPGSYWGQAYSALSIIFLYTLGWSVSWLAATGRYSYSIYLFHVFGTAGARIVLTRLGIDQVPLLFAGAMAAGVLLPIVLDRVLSTWAVTSTVLLGKPWESRSWRVFRRPGAGAQ